MTGAVCLTQANGTACSRGFPTSAREFRVILLCPTVDQSVATMGKDRSMNLATSEGGSQQVADQRTEPDAAFLGLRFDKSAREVRREP